ncbi:hypothetical protein KJ849_01155 [bacterium]|nr:hypothetical protein [bacterium]
MENLLILLSWLALLVFLERLAKKREVKRPAKPSEEISSKETLDKDHRLPEISVPLEAIKKEGLIKEEGPLSNVLPREESREEWSRERFKLSEAKKAVIYSEIFLPPRCKRPFLFKGLTILIMIANLSILNLHAEIKNEDLKLKEVETKIKNEDLKLKVAEEPKVSGTLIKKIKAPEIIPEGMAFDGKDLWILDLNLYEDLQPTIYQLSPEEGKILSYFSTPGKQPQGLAFDGHYLWNIDLNTESDLEKPIVYKINLDLRNATVAFPLSELSPESMPTGITWDGKYLWCADFNTHQIFKIDVLRGKLLHKINAPASYPTGLAFKDGFLWVSCVSTQRIYKIDLKEGKELYSFPHPGQYPYGLCFEGEYLWSGDYLDCTLYKMVP